MKKLITIAVLVLSSSVSFAKDNLGSIMTAGPWTTFTYSPYGFTTDGTYSNTKFFSMGVDDFKVVLNSQEDAQVFLASEGQVVTARLQQAVHTVRLHLEQQEGVSDVEIAQWIVGL